MIRYWDHQDRKHWEIRLGPIMLDRRCNPRRPCSHHNWPKGYPHPVTLTIARKS
jgi:hypothetical protein